MRQLTSATWLDGDGAWHTRLRGQQVLADPRLNKGTAFPAEERAALGLIGLLPPRVLNLDDQAERAYAQYLAQPNDLAKHVVLSALHDRNEVLFYRLLSDHLGEMLPIVYTPTIGDAIVRYSHLYNRPRGVYLSVDHPEQIAGSLAATGLGPDDVDLLVATDAQAILGIGDWGIGGMAISVGKLAVYTAAAGIDPSRAIPVMLDVGTNRESLLKDPMYIGNRHARVRGKRYDAFIDSYVKVVTKLFPGAIIQWADFAPGNGRRILQKYGGQICTFNDDVQGAGAITLAAAISAMRVLGTPLGSQRVVIFGAGTAGMGIADQLRDAMAREGMSSEEASRRLWCVDTQGLLTDDMGARLRDYQLSYARPAAEVRQWKRSGAAIGLDEVVRRIRPTMLIGTSTVGSAFTEEIIRQMASTTERPIIFALSNPAPQAEATPSELIAWTDGRALIATGSPFAPVTHKGMTYVVGHASNAMLYPGLCLGAIVSGASRISSGMLAAAANAVSSLVAVRQPGASLLPQVDDLRSVSMTVAVAVAQAAAAEGLANVELVDVVQQVQDAMWLPEYSRIKAS